MLIFYINYVPHKKKPVNFPCYHGYLSRTVCAAVKSNWNLIAVDHVPHCRLKINSSSLHAAVSQHSSIYIN